MPGLCSSGDVLHQVSTSPASYSYFEASVTICVRTSKLLHNTPIFCCRKLWLWFGRAGYDFSSTDICCCEKNIIPNIKGQGFLMVTKHSAIKKLKFLKERARERGKLTVWTRTGKGQTGTGSRANSKLSYFSNSCHHMPGAVLRTGKSIMSQRDGLSVPHSCMLWKWLGAKWWARKPLSAVAS